MLIQLTHKIQLSNLRKSNNLPNNVFKIIQSLNILQKKVIYFKIKISLETEYQTTCHKRTVQSKFTFFLKVVIYNNYIKYYIKHEQIFMSVQYLRLNVFSFSHFFFNFCIKPYIKWVSLYNRQKKILNTVGQLSKFIQEIIFCFLIEKQLSKF